MHFPTTPSAHDRRGSLDQRPLVSRAVGRKAFVLLAATWLVAVAWLPGSVRADNAAVPLFIGSRPTMLYMPLVETACPTICGTVRIENGGVCCIGGPPGATITMTVRFAAASAGEAIMDMRTDNQYCSSTHLIDQNPWEPFVASRTYTTTLPPGWSSFAVRAQYRDAAGDVSPVYCDDVSLEGYEMPPTP